MAAVVVLFLASLLVVLMSCNVKVKNTTEPSYTNKSCAIREKSDGGPQSRVETRWVTEKCRCVSGFKSAKTVWKNP